MIRARDITHNAYLKENNTLVKETAGNCLTYNQLGYNCGSFALGVWSKWYLPYGEKEDMQITDLRDLCSDGEYDEVQACDLMADVYVRYMTRSPLIREVQSERELRDDEYLVLFKASLWDFHYVRRLDDGTYWHKMGRTDIRQISAREAWSDGWWAGINDVNCYCGDLRLLAVKRGR